MAGDSQHLRWTSDDRAPRRNTPAGRAALAVVCKPISHLGSHVLRVCLNADPISESVSTQDKPRFVHRSRSLQRLCRRQAVSCIGSGACHVAHTDETLRTPSAGCCDHHKSGVPGQPSGHRQVRSVRRSATRHSEQPARHGHWLRSIAQPRRRCLSPLVHQVIPPLTSPPAPPAPLIPADSVQRKHKLAPLSTYDANEARRARVTTLLSDTPTTNCTGTTALSYV